METSVVMPVHKITKYLGKSIEAILNQTYDNFEFIIINDGGGQKVRDYIKKDKRLIYLENENNKGIAYSLNKAINAANGMYIARVDANAVSGRNRLAVQIKQIKQGYDVVGCFYKRVDNKMSYIVKLPVMHNDIVKVLSKYSPIIHPGVVYKKEAFSKVGGYDESYRYAQDYHLWIKMAQNAARFYNIPKVLVIRYLTTSSSSVKNRKKQVYFELKAKLYGIRTGYFSMFSIIWCIKPFMVWILPNWVRILFLCVYHKFRKPL